MLKIKKTFRKERFFCPESSYPEDKNFRFFVDLSKNGVIINNDNKLLNQLLINYKI